MFSDDGFDPRAFDYPFFVEFNLESFEGPLWLYWRLLNLSGWLRFVEARLSSPLGLLRRTLIVGCTDEGNALPKWQVEGILPLVCSFPKETFWLPPDELDDIAEMERWDFMGECDLLALQELEALEGSTAGRLREAEVRVGSVLREAELYVARLQREARDPSCPLDRRSWIKQRIDAIDEQVELATASLRGRLRDIRREAEQNENSLWRSLRQEAEVETLGTVQFTVRNRLHEKQVRLPLVQEEVFSAGVSEQSAQLALAEYFEDAAKRKQARQKMREQEAEEAKKLQLQRKMAAVERKKSARNKTTSHPQTDKVKVPAQTKPRVAERKAIPQLRHDPPAIPARESTVEQQGEDDTVHVLQKALAEPSRSRESRQNSCIDLPSVANLVDKLVRLGPARAEQVERLCDARRLLSPKSRKALGKLKQGKTSLDDPDRNALKHLLHNLKKTGFDVEGFLNVK